MSVSYYTRLIWGIPIKAIRKNVDVIRYNEETGEPYQKTLNIRVYLLPDGSELAENLITDDIIDCNTDDELSIQKIDLANLQSKKSIVEKLLLDMNLSYKVELYLVQDVSY